MVEPTQEQGFDQAQMYVWMKGLESKLNNLIREVNVLKNDASKKQRVVSGDVKHLTEEFLELKRMQDNFQDKLGLVIQELKRTAGAEEVLAMKKYLDLWNPLHFATQRDVERMVEAKLTKR